MAEERDELNRRRRSREEQRKRRQKAKRAMYFRLAMAAAVLILCGVAIFLLSRDGANLSAPVMAPENGEAGSVEETVPVTERLASWDKAPVTIHLAAAGDLNVTDKTVWSGQNGNMYDYTKAFMDVAPILSQADLAVLNFEGNVCGIPYGTQSRSAPQEMIAALKQAGIDLVQMANSCSISNGLIGLQSTLNNIRAMGIEPLGAFSSSAEFNRTKGYTVVTVNDVKIAFVAFTKGVGSLGMPAGSENCVNLLYEDYYTTYQKVNSEGIRTVLKAAAAEKPDLTIALLHWGSEHNDTISESQKDIVALMQKEGVDAIIGSHPHRVHEISYDETTGNLVAYSLGDFFGDAKDSGTNYSIILDLEITKDYETGVTRITDYSYTPIYTLSEEDCDGDRRVVRVENAVACYELNFVDKVSKSCYEAMKTGLERISKRVQGIYN